MQTGVVTRGEWALGEPQRVETPRGARRESRSAAASRERVVVATFVATAALGLAALAAFTRAALLGYTPLF